MEKRCQECDKDISGSLRPCCTDESCYLATYRRLQRNKRARVARREKDSALRSLGLVKVRGALGGVYWE